MARAVVRSAVAFYASVALTTLVAYVCLWKLWAADLRFPLHEVRADALYYCAVAFKGTLENGWYVHNGFLAAPFGAAFHDFPLFESAHLAVIKALGLITTTLPLVVNSFKLGVYAANSCTFTYAARKLGADPFVAACGGLVYSLHGYHYQRGFSHYSLTLYYTVPLVAVIVLRLYRDEWKAFSFRSLARRGTFGLFLGFTGFYYPVFSVLLLGFGALAGAARARRLRPVLWGAAVVGCVTLGLLIDASSSLLYRYEHGSISTPVRSVADSERYAFKLAHLVVPNQSHRFEWLHSLGARYDSETLLNSENRIAYLGLIGAIGFVVLALLPFVGRRSRGVMQDIARLNLFTLLLGTIGGLGSLISFFVLTEVRGYNRLSIFVLTFVLLAVSLCATRWIDGFDGGRRLLARAAIGTLTVFGLYEQSFEVNSASYARLRASWDRDAAFIAGLEAKLPRDAAVLQMPDMSFPEAPTLVKLESYELLRPYLHSRTLRWSFGATRDRYGDRWRKHLEKMPIPERMRAAALCGFSAVYVDGRGYADGGSSIFGEIEAVLGAPLARSEHVMAFSLAAADLAAHAQLTPGDYARQRELLLTRPDVNWLRGFSGEETLPGETWRWSGGAGEAVFENPGKRPRRVSFVADLQAIVPMQVSVRGLGLERVFDISPNHPARYERTFDLAPGETRLRFSTATKPVRVPGDARDLAFRVHNPVLSVDDG